MQKYIGAIRAKAKPMSLGEYNQLRGWDVPENENPDDAGYLVETANVGISNHPDYAGFISWQPKSIFEATYQAQPDVVAPSESDCSIEKEIQEKGLNAPRVTLDNLHEKIKDVEVIRFKSSSDQIIRIAVLTMLNGYSVVGRPSVAVSPENDDDEIGTKIAVENAMREFWPLLGLLLKEKCAGDKETATNSKKDINMQKYNGSTKAKYKVGDTVVLRKIHQFGEELGYKNGEALTIASIDKDGDLWFEEPVVLNCVWSQGPWSQYR